MQRRVEFTVGKQKLVGDLHLPDDGKSPFPCVVLSHGYMSNRSGEKHLQIAYRFPLQGMAVLRFDHRGALDGESEGKFEDTTITGRAQDLAAATDFLKTVPEVDSSRIGLLGSSLGGTAILALPPDARVKAIVLLSTPVALSAPDLQTREAFAKQGYYQYPNGPRIKKDFYEDMARYNLREQVKKIKSPMLIVHGDLDEQVPRHQAYVLYQCANEPKKLHLIEGADHSFNDTEKLNQVLALALDWFRKYLSP